MADFRIDDFEGERVDPERLTDERLVEIRAKTETEIRVARGSVVWWEAQLDIIDEEIEARKAER